MKKRLAGIGAAVVATFSLFGCGITNSADYSVGCVDSVVDGKPTATYTFTIFPVDHDRTLKLYLADGVETLASAPVKSVEQRAHHSAALTYSKVDSDKVRGNVWEDKNATTGDLIAQYNLTVPCN